MVNNPKNIQNIANVQYNYTPEPGVIKTDFTESTPAGITVYNPDLYTKKIVCNQTVAPGGTLKFTLLGVNSGDTDLSGVSFKEFFGKGINYVNESAVALVNGLSTNYTLTTNPNWIITVPATIKPQDEVIVNLAVTVDSNLSFTNLSITNAFTGGYIYPDPNTNTPLTIDPAPIPSPSSVVSISLNYAKLSITKQVQSVVNGVPSGNPVTSVTAGSEIAYVITLANQGNVTAINVQGHDLLPESLNVTVPDGISIPKANYTLTNNYFYYSGLTVPAASLSGTNILPGSQVINITGTIR